MAKFSVHDIFCITIYRCTKCTCKSRFQNDVTHFPQCMSHNEIIVLLSVLSVLLGNHRITRIVGLIQIHVASLESVWTSMLHNRVSILKWHLFILSIPLLRVIDPWTFDGIIFNGTTLPIYINTTCYIAYHQGHSTFFVGRDVRGGSPKWPGASVFRGGYPRKTSCKSTVGANRLAGPIMSWTDHFLSVNDSPICIWKKMRTSGAAFFAFLTHIYYRPNTCQLATVTVGRPSRVNVQRPIILSVLDPVDHSVTNRLTMLRHRPRLSSTVYGSSCLPDCSKGSQKWSDHPHVNKWFQCGQYIYLHIVWRVILYTVWFCMATVFIWSISGPLCYGSNLYVIGKENVLSLLSVIFVLCNRVQSSKITSYFELFWTKYFQFGWQNVSTYFSTFFKTDWQIFCIFTEY